MHQPFSVLSVCECVCVCACCHRRWLLLHGPSVAVANDCATSPPCPNNTHTPPHQQVAHDRGPLSQCCQQQDAVGQALAAGQLDGAGNGLDRLDSQLLNWGGMSVCVWGGGQGGRGQTVCGGGQACLSCCLRCCPCEQRYPIGLCAVGFPKLQG